LGNNKKTSNPHINCNFELLIKSVHLSFVHNYSFKQERIYRVIKYLKEVNNLGYKRISDILCSRGYKTVRSNKPILHNYVYSIYKNGKIRERRKNIILNTEIKNMRCSIKFY